MTLSILVTVCNERELLRDCLESVKWADEIVIVDMHSEDGSDTVYRQYTDKVVFHKREIIADLVLAFGLMQVTGDWVLVIAPDERLSPRLAASLREIVSSESTYAAYRLPFKDFIFGKHIQYTGWQLNRTVGQIRLFRRSKVHWVPQVHTQPTIDGSVGSIVYSATEDNAVIHLNYTSVTQFIEKLNRYTTAEAGKMQQNGRTFSWRRLIAAPVGEFWRRYIKFQGYRDGAHGFILSLLQSAYALVSYVKLWELTVLPGGNAAPEEHQGDA